MNIRKWVASIPIATVPDISIRGLMLLGAGASFNCFLTVVKALIIEPMWSFWWVTSWFGAILWPVVTWHFIWRFRQIGRKRAPDAAKISGAGGGRGWIA